jgi:hypothetical protein
MSSSKDPNVPYAAIVQYSNDAEKKKYGIDYGRNKQLQINKIIN